MIPWSDPQRQQISQILTRYPVASNRCADAARDILPIGEVLDPQTCALVVQPAGFAIYVQPKNVHTRWVHHVTVAVVEHCVDVLTGADGHNRNTYLAHYFDHPDAHVVRPVEPDEWEVL